MNFYAFKHKVHGTYFSKYPVTERLTLSRDPGVIYYFTKENEGVSFFFRSKRGRENAFPHKIEEFDIVEILLP